MKHLFLYISLFLFTIVSMVQAQETEPNDPIAIRYANVDGVVKLRWAPVSPELWKTAMQTGYMLERITYRENGQHLDPPFSEFLTNNPILPANKNVWAREIVTNDNAAIIAQAFWGKSFQLQTKNTTRKMTTVLDQSTDLNQRFAFSLMAADMDFEAAMLAGWGFVDDNVSPGGYYKYRIYFYDESGLSEEFAEVEVDMQRPYQMPAPFGVYALFDENLAKVSWELSFTKDTYTAYNIERSADNVHFTRLNTAPYVVTSSDENNIMPKRGEFTDSIPNDQVFYYRINGIDCFGQVSPYSRIVSGKASRKLKAVPQIDKTHFLSEQLVTFHWVFSEEEQGLIRGFDIFRAEHIDGPYEPVSDLLPPETRDFELTMKPSNYIIVRALGLKDEATVSGAHFIQQPDNTPPVKPSKPFGEIDSSGVVTLWWHPNTDEDIAGYHVYYSRLDWEEFVEINKTAVTDTVFTDTISLNTFIEHINYTIRAIDRRNNHSDFSDTLVLELPDLLKPVSPYFLGQKVDADSVQLTWVNSSSHDVAVHKLFRMEAGDEAWTEIARFDTLGVTSYTDHDLEEKTKYYYILLAIDDDGLESKPSSSIMAYVPAYVEADPVEKFSASLDRSHLKVTLKWEKNEKMEGFQLYKREDNYAPFLMKSFPSKENRFVDNQIKKFANYKYMIRSKGKNGKYSPFSEVILNW